MGLTYIKYLKDFSYGTARTGGVKTVKAGQQFNAFKIGNKIYADSGFKYEITPIVQEVYKEFTQTVTDAGGNVTTNVVSNIPKKTVVDPVTPANPSGTSENGKTATETTGDATEPKKWFGVKRTYVVIGGIVLLLVVAIIIFRKKIF